MLIKFQGDSAQYGRLWKKVAPLNSEHEMNQ